MEVPSAGAVSAMMQAVTRDKISIAVAVKANDAAKAQGEMVLKLLEGATQTANSTASGSGGHKLDITA